MQPVAFSNVLNVAANCCSDGGKMRSTDRRPSSLQHKALHEAGKPAVIEPPLKRLTPWGSCKNATIFNAVDGINAARHRAKQLNTLHQMPFLRFGNAGA